MGVKIVNPSTIHYLKRDKFLESRDLIQLGGPHSHLLIKNPFIGLKSHNEIISTINEYNDLLMRFAPLMAINLFPKRNRAKARFDVFGSINLSGNNPKVILATNSKGLDEDIVFQGVVGDDFNKELPSQYHELIKQPNIYLTKTTRFIYGPQFDTEQLAKAPQIGLYKPSLYRELLFWSKPSNINVVKNFLTAEDAKAISKQIALATGDAFDVNAYIMKNTFQTGRKRVFSSKIFQHSFDELGQLLGEISQDKTFRKKFNVFFKTNLIGQLSQFDAASWSFVPQHGALVPFKNTQNNYLPTFIDNLMPEGAYEVSESDYESFFEEEHSFIGDICIRKLGSSKPPVSAIITTPLEKCTNQDGEFKGMLRKIKVQYGKVHQCEVLKDATRDISTSGFAEKIPVSVHIEDGVPVIQPAITGDTFTHLFKLPNTGHHVNLETCEWFGMTMAKSAGLPAPAFALVPNSEEACISESKGNFFDDAFDSADALSNQMYGKTLSGIEEVKKTGEVQKPNYIIERFDIDSTDSGTVSIGEDLSSLLSLRPTQKYFVKFETVAEYIKDNSTHWDEDREYLLRILTSNILVNNSDMHAKNLSMLRRYDKATNALVENRLSPIYDIVALDRRLFTGRFKDAAVKHALSVNGSKEYSYDNLITFAVNTLDYTKDSAKEIVTDVCRKILTASDALYRKPPALLAHEGQPNDELISLVRFVEANYDTYLAADVKLDKEAIYGKVKVDDETMENAFSFI